MRYHDGREVQLGDFVDLDGVEGTVVAVIDTGQFDPAYAAKDWAYLTSGVLINTTTIGLVHVADLDVDDRLVRRRRRGQIARDRIARPSAP